MHIQTHIMSGWCVASYFNLTPRERFLCIAAASVSDLDGLGILFGNEAYWDYHHVLGHNLLFGAVFSVTFALIATHRLKVLLLSLALFHLHFVLDYYGSGPGWSIYYLWPSSNRGLRHPDPWAFYSWQNISAAGLFLAGTLVIAVRHGRSPLELFLPDLDRRFVAWLRARTSYSPASVTAPAP